MKNLFLLGSFLKIKKSWKTEQFVLTDISK